MEISYLFRLNLLSRGLVGTLIWMHAATYANGADGLSPEAPPVKSRDDSPVDARVRE